MLSFFHLFPELLLLALVSGVAYYVATAIYILYFHPLSRFPGPKLWLITRIPNARSLANGQLMHRIRQFHELYGPVVRWAPNELSFIDGQAWKDIYGHHPAGPINGAHTILSADNVTHTRIRKLISRGFSEKALQEQESFIKTYTRLLIEKLQVHAQAGRSVDIGEYIQFATVDIAGDLIFGESFDCLAREEAHQWVKVTFGFFKRLLTIAA
ncbi:monooxygenase [Penicillium chermesinum]|nr:monooxygenase [Penicillium chermesinum]